MIADPTALADAPSRTPLFAAALRTWQRALANAAPERRAAVFENAAVDVAAWRMFAKTERVDALRDMAVAHDLADGDSVIAEAFALAERVPDIIEQTEHSARAAPSVTVDPVDLWAKFEPPDLPEGLLPDVIERYARTKGEVMGADPSGLAAAALAVCAAAIPDGVELKTKRYDNWHEAARLWVAVIGLPSTKKSPIIHQAARPLKIINASLTKDYLRAREEYEAASDKEAVDAPKRHQVTLEDTTIEAAQEILKDSPDGVLCLQDELSGWFGSMDKYSGVKGAAKDRGFWLQAYNGGGYTVSRIGRGLGFIENLSASVLGGIQPDPIRKLAADGVDDGLLQRLIMIVLRPALPGKDEPLRLDVAKYEYLVESLRKLQKTTLVFDDDAQDLLYRLEVKHHDLQKFETVNPKLATHIGKYDGIFARLCIVWHCIENVDVNPFPQVLTFGTAGRAAAFLHRFLLPHALAFYAGVLGLSDEHDRLTAVAGYILSRKLERVTNRDVQRGDRTMRRLESRDIAKVFEQLDALGWISRVPGPRPSSPPQWIVNPEVHRQFEAKAAHEAERRQCERELIASCLQGKREKP